MQRIRNWYPNQEVWVILDQARAHPRKSHETRPIPRALKRHWISLPKASPDDNAVETWVSDIPLAILDPSNDPTPNATQQVIQVRRVY